MASKSTLCLKWEVGLSRVLQCISVFSCLLVTLDALSIFLPDVADITTKLGAVVRLFLCQYLFRIRNDASIQEGSQSLLIKGYKYCSWVVLAMCLLVLVTTVFGILSLFFPDFIWTVFYFGEGLACLALVPLALKINQSATQSNSQNNREEVVYDMSVVSCVTCYLCDRKEAPQANLAMQAGAAQQGWTNKV